MPFPRVFDFACSGVKKSPLHFGQMPTNRLSEVTGKTDFSVHPESTVIQTRCSHSRRLRTHTNFRALLWASPRVRWKEGFESSLFSRDGQSIRCWGSVCCSCSRSPGSQGSSSSASSQACSWASSSPNTKFGQLFAPLTDVERKQRFCLCSCCGRPARQSG